MSGIKGISVSLQGTSSVGVGCLCRYEDAMWEQLHYNGVTTIRCLRCDRMWHKCPLHQIDVKGMGPSTSGCTCGKTWMPTTGDCPHCGGRQFIMPTETHTTKQCARCRSLYHTCPLHGNSVKGPGYHKSSLTAGGCQCHENHAFLEPKVWSKPFA